MLLNLALLDLIYYSKNTRNAIISVSEMGKKYMEMTNETKCNMLGKLMFRFPLLRVEKNP